MNDIYNPVISPTVFADFGLALQQVEARTLIAVDDVNDRVDSQVNDARELIRARRRGAQQQGTQNHLVVRPLACAATVVCS